MVDNMCEYFKVQVINLIAVILDEVQIPVKHLDSMVI